MRAAIGIILFFGAVIGIFHLHAQAERYVQPGTVIVIPIRHDTSDLFDPTAVSDLQFNGRLETLAEGILYITPNIYNPVRTHLEAEELLTALNRHPQDYTITSINAYIGSIALRGQILIALGGLVFLFAMAKIAVKAIKEQSWALATAVILGSIAVGILLLPYVSLDLWVPAFAPEGFGGYLQLIFNTSLLAPSQYLTDDLAALQNLNLWANIAFGVGVLVLSPF